MASNRRDFLASERGILLASRRGDLVPRYKNGLFLAAGRWRRLALVLFLNNLWLALAGGWLRLTWVALVINIGVRIFQSAASHGAEETGSCKRIG